MTEKRLARCLNDFVDERYALVPREVVEVYGGGDWVGIHRLLASWERRGHLAILKNPERAARFEPCLRLKNFIGASAPLGGFLGQLRDEMPPFYQARWQQCSDDGENSDRPPS